MTGPRPPFPPTFTVDPLLPPPRPPRIRPPSRSSSVATDPYNSGVWPEVTLATLINQPEDKFYPNPYSYYKDYVRESFIDMRMDSTDTISPIGDSPIHGLGHKFPPLHDPSKLSGEQKTDSTYSRPTVTGAPIPSTRSKLRSVCLVLSCTGAMIINVSGPPAFAKPVIDLSLSLCS